MERRLVVATTAYSVAALVVPDEPWWTPMAGHVLRAMAHQAVDLGHIRQGLELAAASMDGKRYLMASPRERALFGVVYARALGAAGQKPATTKALITAEDDPAAGLDEFSHLEIVFRFHLTDPSDLNLGARRARDNPDWPEVGTFGHRNMRRVHWLGVSRCRLVKVDALDLHVDEVAEQLFHHRGQAHPRPVVALALGRHQLPPATSSPVVGRGSAGWCATGWVGC